MTDLVGCLVTNINGKTNECLTTVYCPDTIKAAVRLNTQQQYPRYGRLVYHRNQTRLTQSRQSLR
jgi:hypothetical protein